MRELIGLWIVMMVAMAWATVDEAFYYFRAWINAIAMVGAVLAMLFLGLYLLGG